MKNITKLLTTRQVSEYLGIPLRTIQHLSKQGKIKAIRVGSRWKYNKEDIERYRTFGTDLSAAPTRKYTDFVEQSDRRSYPRINSNLTCQYSIKILPIKELDNEGIIKDISAGGVLLVVQDNGIDRIKINDPIDLDFSLISKHKTTDINTEGRIVRIDNNKLGIKFRSMDEEIKKEIIQYVG